MSTVPDIEQGCPGTSETPTQKEPICDEVCEHINEKKKKKSRNVCFPDDGELVTQYFEPANPWQHVPSTSRAQLAAEYLESCRRHSTPPIEIVLQQIRELPENSIGGGNRAPRLCLAECTLSGSAAVDALEALLRKVQFRRVEIDHAVIDDEGAEALFDIIEYYESATVVCLSGPRQFGIRGWQAASRMIKKSAELSELEITESGLEASHAPVLARALKPHTCRLRSLCLQRTELCGEPLLSLVIALKSNSSIRELRLGDNRLTAADAAQLASMLRLNTTIHLLDLSNNQIQDTGAGHIAEALVNQAAQTPPSVATSPISPHHCPLMGGHETRGLAFLVLWNNQLTRNCAQHLSKALRSSQSLCVLNVGRNALGGETVRALQGAGGLVSLGLQAARLGPEAARAVADLIRHDSTLQRLDLRDNRLGSSGLQAILNAMKENTTLTQIDLDDPTDSPTNLLEDTEAGQIARLTRDIRALCRRNEPDATSPERRVHRKISLTCNTTCLVRTPLCMEEERRSSRLRSPLPSPAPSPAGSPVPLQHSQSRFSVTRVTPDRESSTDSSSPSTPTRPTYCPTPSRFKVVQVAEPPQIQVHPASNEPRKSLSRFSVTRNYDKMYNPSPSPSPVPSSGSDTPAEDMCDEDSVKDVKSIEKIPKGDSQSEILGNINSNLDVKNLKSDKRTASDRFSVSVVSNIKDSQSKDDRLKLSSDNCSTSVVDDVERSKSTSGSVKSGNSKRFSVSNVVENPGENKTHKRFSTSLVSDDIKHVMPSTSQSDMGTVSNKEIIDVDLTSQSTSVNILPVGSEISQRFSITNVPENLRGKDSNNSCSKDVSSPDKVLVQNTENVTTPLTSRSRLKSCMRNSENNREGTSRSTEDVRNLRRENSETSEVLTSHPNLKSISDLFKSLEIYGNTADNTVSLTSLTESKRPSVRDIFDVNQTDSGLNANVITDEKSCEIRNIESTESNVGKEQKVIDETKVVIDDATEARENTPLISNTKVTELNKSISTSDNVVCTTCYEVNQNRNICVSTDDVLHVDTFTDTPVNMTAKQDNRLINKEVLIPDEISHQTDTIIDVCMQANVLDILKAVGQIDRDNNLIKHTTLPVAISEHSEIIKKEHQKANITHNLPKRSESGDILETIYEGNKLHCVEEVITKTPKAENIIETKNVPESIHIGTTLSPGSTPHPSKGVRTFIMPEFHINDDSHMVSSDNDLSDCLRKLTIASENFELCDQTGNFKVSNKTIDDKERKFINKDKEIRISIDDEFPVFDPIYKEYSGKDNAAVITNVHKVMTQKNALESEKHKVPDSKHSNSIQETTTEMQEIISKSNMNETMKYLQNKAIIDDLNIPRNDNLPSFLPESTVFSNETEYICEFDTEMSKTLKDLRKESSEPKLPELKEGNLPGAVEPNLVSEVPIYSISPLVNIPSTSKAIFQPRDVMTQTDLLEIDPSLTGKTLKHVIDSMDLPGVVPDTRQDSRLTETAIDLSNLATVSRQSEIIPELTDSKPRSVNLPRENISAVFGHVSAIDNTDFSSIIDTDINLGLEIQTFLEEFRHMSLSTGLAKAQSNVQNDTNIDEHLLETKTSTYETVIPTDINVSERRKDGDKDYIRSDRDTHDNHFKNTAAGDDNIIKDTVSENVSRNYRISGEVIYEETNVKVGNENISDKTDLIYKNLGGVSETWKLIDNPVRKDSITIGSVTIDNECVKEDINYDIKTVGDGNDNTIVDSDKRDQYKDVSEILTHSETKKEGVIKSETQLVKNTVEIADDEKIDVEFKMTVKTENMENKACKSPKIEKKEDALKRIELITKDLGDLIDEMKVVKGDREKKDHLRNKTSNSLDKATKVKNEQEKAPDDIQNDEKLLKIHTFHSQEMQTKDSMINIDERKSDESNIDKNDSDRHRMEMKISEIDVKTDIKETEQYIKYLRANETISERDTKIESDGISSVKDRVTESHTGMQRHIIETERHRKEVVIDRRESNDHRKCLDSRVKKEMKDRPVKVKESVLKKNRSESSLDSSDMEVSRLMHKHINPFCDSSSSLEISGSSIESLTEPKLIITKDNVDSDIELDRRKEHTLSTGSSVESTDVTPMNTNLLNMSVSSNESVSPIFGKTKNIRDSLSSLEASVSSIESNRQDRVMVTSADSGIEHSLPKDIHESSSNEGTLTNPLNIKHDTLTASPKRASSLLDVPALKSKGLDRMRKISWVAPSSSFNVAKQDDKDVKPSHLEKLLSLFQHPSSIFSRNTEEEKKSSTPPKKDSLLTSSFWSWGSGERDKDDSSEATDSTLSERVQVSFIDESFSKKLDSKTPSTDTENTLSEFQTFTQSERECENIDTCKVTLNTTDKSVVQIDLSLKCTEANNGNRKVSNSLDVVSPNDFNKNYDTNDSNKNSENSPELTEQDVKREEKPAEVVRPRSFAAVLKASGSENSLEKQNSPEGQPVDKLPSKIIRGIKENISPENTLTSSMSNTKALALELTERQLKNQPVVNTVWELTNPLLSKGEEKTDLAPIATIEETCDESADLIQLDYIDDEKASQKEVDVAKDALSYLIYENQDFDPKEQTSNETPGQSSLADELKQAEIKEMFDLSPELIIDEAIEVPEVFTAKDVKGIRTSPIIPERAKLKKSNSLEDLKTEIEKNPKAKTIVFKVPESKPRDIPERSKLRSRSGSSPKSLPESLNKPCPLTKIDAISKKKKKVSSLGKMAKDSLLALNMSEEEIAEFRRSYKLTSVESLRSLESVSEDANSQSGNSVDSRCRACLRTSQESLMSLDSITEDVCRCDDSEKPGKSHR